MHQTYRAEVVAIGASAGGVEALAELVEQLPWDFSAPIIVVLHISPTGTSVLPQILTRRGPLVACAAENRMPLTPGRIYVAPADYHVRAVDGHLTLDREPRENGHRPAVDPLFRSVAQAFGPAAVGVIMSGSRDDGTAGLQAIKAAGGWAMVQDPASALFASMPESAIANVAVDAVLPAEDLAKALDELTRVGSITYTGGAAPMNHDPATDTEPGPLTGGPVHFACPDCGGVVTEYVEGELPRFRCHVGHQYSLESLLDGHYQKVEEALWTAVRALEERAAMLRRTFMVAGGQSLSSETRNAQAGECEDRARTVRDAITSIRPAVEEAGVAR